MMNELLQKMLAQPNLYGGIACALIAVVLGTRPLSVGWRDYGLIVAAAILTTASVIDYWFIRHGFFVCCLIGFAIGYLADDVITTLNATMPRFIRQAVRDILDWLRDWLTRMLNK